MATTIVEATCYGSGYTRHDCLDCDYSYQENQKLQTACDYVKTTVEATCTTDGYDQYTCKFCQDTYKNITVRSGGHNTANVLWSATDVQVEGCEYNHIETAKCNICEEDVSVTETIHKHEYELDSITHATCTTAGQKVLTCKYCPESKTEEIAIDANAHAWDNGVTEGNITTYTCAHNSEHKKQVF
jgi:hypothetical protein